ncbi:alpha-tectorin-like, partial [Scomber scombrus]
MFRGIWDSLDADAAPDVWCVFLVLSSCPSSADKTVKVEGNGLGTSNYFSFNMFQFSGKDGDVYLHCKLNLCVKKGNTCTPSCGGGKRRRRSARNRYVDVNPAFITMAW